VAFLKLLQDDHFQSQLVLVAIDELHVVEEWGETWRASYSMLLILRDLIRRDVPWFGASATLDPIMLENVKISVGFASDVKILQTSIDRPDITFHIRPMQHSITSFKDLEFVVEAACERPIQAADILKDRFADAFAEISMTQVAKKVRNVIQKGDMNIAR